MKSGSVLLVAEAGVNHNGDPARARDMIAAAAEAGADVVKFQAFRADEIVSECAATAPYQRSNTGLRNQAEMLRSLELAPDDFAALGEECRRRGIEFMATPFDAGMLDLLLAAGMQRIKIASGEITNVTALRTFGATGRPIIMSTGMATLVEVEQSVAVLRECGASDITLLHCTSLYPAPDEAINLRAMVTMREALCLPVGYSDHSLGDHVAVAAVALGAVVIEKHFTLDKRLPGPDHRASLDPGELGRLVLKLRATAVALGDGEKRPTAAETETAALVRRSWHTTRNLPAGASIGREDVHLKRPATGLPPNFDPIGRLVAHALESDVPLRASDLI